MDLLIVLRNDLDLATDDLLLRFTKRELQTTMPEDGRPPVLRFSVEGDKVKITVMFRGREMVHTYRGRQQLNQVIEALQKIEGLPGVTVSEVLGFGRARAAHAKDKVVDGSIAYARKAKLEIVIPDHLLDRVLKSILDKARTGNPGDGKIFIVKIEEAISILTGNRGDKAI